MTFDLHAAVWNSAPGAQLQVPAGVYPDPLTIDKPIHLVGDGLNPPTLGGIRVNAGSSGSSFSGLNFAPTPDATSNTASSAIWVLGAHDIVFQQCRAQYGAWNGQLTGRAATIQNSRHVTLSGCDLSFAYKGVDFANSTDCIIAGCSVHDVATSPIVGSMCDRLKVLQNHLRASNPAPPNHGDFIHIYTNPAQVGPTDGITVVGNTFDLVPSTNVGWVLGGNFEDQTNKGYTNVNFSNNVLNLATAQGLIVEGWRSGRANNNVIHPVKGADPHSGIPTIIVRPNLIPLLPTLDIDISGNTCADDSLHHLSRYFPNNTFLTAAQIAALIA